MHKYVFQWVKYVKYVLYRYIEHLILTKILNTVPTNLFLYLEYLEFVEGVSSLLQENLNHIQVAASTGKARGCQ